MVFLPLKSLPILCCVGTEVGTGRDKRSGGRVDKYRWHIVFLRQMGGIKSPERTGDETRDGIISQKIFHITNGCFRCDRVIGEEKLLAIMLFQK